MKRFHCVTVCWLVTVLIGAINVSLAVEGNAEGSKPVVSWTGTDSRVIKARSQRISNRDDWIAVWLEHQGNNGDPKKYDFEKNTAKVPDVDFSTHMVIAVFEGKTVNSAGFSNASWRTTANEIVFRFDIEYYGTQGGFDNVTPFGLYVVPRSEKAIWLQVPKPPADKSDPPTGEWQDFGRIVKLEKTGS